MFLKINNQHVGWKGDLVTCYNVTCKIKMYRARVMTSQTLVSRLGTMSVE